MNRTSYHSDADTGAAVRDKGAHATEGGDNTVRTRLSLRQGNTRALQEVAAGIRCGAAPLQFMESIDVANRQLGNRAFMRWVGSNHAAGLEKGTREMAAGGAREQGPLLQFGPKKHKKKKEPVAPAAPGPQPGAAPKTGSADVTGATQDTAPETGTRTGPETAVTETRDEAQETATGGVKKKKKKSRVQVALNTLREEGVEAFRGYIGTQIGETELLDTLTLRITRAQDLGGVRDAALDVVQARLKVLDPLAVADVPPEQGMFAEKPSVASERAVLRPWEVELFDACLRGDAERFQQFLEIPSIDVNLAIEFGTLLYLAAINGCAPIVAKLLSRRGINVNLAGKEGATPLIGAAQKGHLEVVKLLLDAPGINPNLGSLFQGTTAITIAAFAGHKEVVELLLAAGNININVRQRDGATPVFAAIQGNHPDIVELLVRRGANVNLGMSDGTTPLAFAASEGYAETARHLLQAPYIQVNPRISALGTTPLIVAAYRGHKEMVRLLLAAGNIKVNVRQKDGATALYAASQFNHLDVVGMLIGAGADVNLPFNDDITPLCLATHQGSIKLVQHLLQAPGVQVNQTDRLNASALGHACRKGHKEVVELLLNNGADPNIGNDGGLSAIHAACYYGYAEIVELLLNNKARVNTVDKAGLAPVHLACLLGYREIVEMLLKKGADADMVAENGFTPYWAASVAGHQAIMSLLATRGQRPAGQAAHLASQSHEDLPGQTASTKTSPALLPQTGDIPAVAGGQAPLTEMQSPLGQAKQELREDIFIRLRNDRLDTGDGFKLLEAVNSVADLDGLCGIYIRLAKIERKKMRTGEKPFGREFAVLGEEAESDDIPGYALGDKSGLDAEAVEDEIKKHLAQAYHRFVSQAVNDMEFGRGKPTSGYPGVLHVSAGMSGIGSCSVFFYRRDEAKLIRIVGIGHHLDRRTYRLGYAAAELQGLRTIRLS